VIGNTNFISAATYPIMCLVVDWFSSLHNLDLHRIPVEKTE